LSALTALGTAVLTATIRSGLKMLINKLKK
jgi:hypothetical protein